MMDRRRFLTFSAVGAAAGSLGACSLWSADRAAEPGGSGPADLRMSFGPAETDIDLGGVSVPTWAYGNQVPGPEIRLRKGQRLHASLTNKLPGADTTIHWHGLAIPNPMDGVPVLTQPPTPVGQTFEYDFVIPDSGTYYYHSHVGTQLDRGLYGPIVIEDPDEGDAYDDELVVVLDDWIDGTGTTPDQVLENLRTTGMRDMGDMGPDAGITPSTPMGGDGGDVVYPYYLINGRVSDDPQVADFRPGQRIRLRVINAGGDTVFVVAVPNHAMTITHTDGFPVVPEQADSVILGMGERFDAIITLESSVPVVAAAYRKDGHARMNLRVSNAATGADIDDFVSTLRTMVPLDTASLAAAPEVNLPPGDPDRVIDMRLAGPVDGYNWTINGRLYDPPNDGYPVEPGERVRIRYINESAMVHPMHLHGHTFQVMTPTGGTGADGFKPMARKDTVLVAPLATIDVDIDTNNPGRWITHCHNVYHLDAGLATFIYYE